MATRITQILFPTNCSVGDLIGLHLLRRCGETTFPGVATARLETFNGNLGDQTHQKWIDRGIFVIGIKPYESPAFVSIAEILSLHKHTFYGHLIKRVWPEFCSTCESSAEIGKILAHLRKHNPAGLLPWTAAIFNADLERQKAFLKAQSQLSAPPSRKEEEQLPSGSIHFEVVVPADKSALPIKGVVVASDSDNMIAAARSRRIAILIQVRSTGHTHLFCFSPAIDMKFVVAEMRKKILRLAGQSKKAVASITAEHLQEEGVISEVPNVNFTIRRDIDGRVTGQSVVNTHTENPIGLPPADIEAVIRRSIFVNGNIEVTAA